ncbi:MAG TPA: nitrilase-related carbon-nitrogen hydrolase [Streptosporangiaceae bacterium]|nr:nitrilase-related carbon-nitrogen hydrolase [Streptosporangiaceae bacterium]
MPPAAERFPVRVAACQLRIKAGDPDANRAAAAAAIEDAARHGAKIVVLPELTPSGYVFATADEARSLGEPADGPTARRWSALAAEHDLVVIGGFAELAADGTLRNSSMLVDADGVRAVYRKAHLWDAEADFFVPGDQPPPVVGTRYGRLSMMICYDVEFPEWVRLPALAGAELLAVPANWPAGEVPAGERPMVTVNVQAAAFANRMFVVAACRCGEERGVRWVGGSIIAGPDGYPLAGPASLDRLSGDAGRAAEEILIAGCDLPDARSKATGPRNDAHADRRPALYGPAGLAAS